MKFKAKLNGRFYFASALLSGTVLFIWHSIYFLNTNEILMEDGTPMTFETKLLFTAASTMIALSWTVSLLALIRQIIIGYAFCIDENGIHYTATSIIVLAFIFVIPIKTIPYSAIQKIEEENGRLTLYLDKANIRALPVLKIFARRKYHLFCGFTSEKPETVKSALYKFIKY